jgi:hypothetical protein
MHTTGTPRFGAVIPDGFEAVPIERGTNVFAMYRRPSDGVLLVFARLPRPIEAGDDGARFVVAAREADPFPFADAPSSFRALGFDIPGVHGTATSTQRPVNRWMAIVPTEGRAFALLAIVPADHDADARRVMEQVLSSVHGPSSWRTRGGRALDTIARTGLALALVICVLYAILVAVAFRGKPERAPLARGSLLALAGLGWMAFSASWFAQGGFVPGLVGFLVAGLGVVMAAQGLGIIRRRKA